MAAQDGKNLTPHLKSPPACDRQRSPLFKADGSAVGLMDLCVFTHDAVTARRGGGVEMLRGLAWAARRLACHAGVGGGWVGGLGRRLGATRMGLCVSTSREDLWFSLQVETHSPNWPARHPGAFFSAWQ